MLDNALINVSKWDPIVKWFMIYEALTDPITSIQMYSGQSMIWEIN